MKIYSDGYTIGSNPSPIGGGYTVVDEFNRLLFTQKEEVTKYDKNGKAREYTNNEGELKACLKALCFAQEGDVVVVDSINTMAWIRAPFSKARPDLMPYAQKCGELMKQKNVYIQWEPRETNKAGHYNENLKVEQVFPTSWKVNRKWEDKHVKNDQLHFSDIATSKQEDNLKKKQKKRENSPTLFLPDSLMSYSN